MRYLTESMAAATLLRSLLFIGIGFIASYSVCLCQFPVQFSIKPEEHRVLWYAQFRNTFDSAQVSYTFGELQRHTSSGSQPVWLAISGGDALNKNHPGVQIVGQDEIGVDNVLLNAARSVPFLIPEDGAQLSFMRVAQAETCYDVPESDRSESGDWNPSQSRFMAGKGRVLDTSVFILEIVDVGTQSVLCIVDSIAILPNPHSLYAPRVGSYPDSVYRRFINLPSSTWGKIVFARVRVERYGPTDFGMVMSRFNQPVALSMQWNNNQLLQDSSVSFSDTPFQLALHEAWFQQFMAYVASHVDSTGCLPALRVLGYRHAIGSHQQSYKDSVLNAWFSQSPQPDCRVHDEVMHEWYMLTTDTVVGYPKHHQATTRSSGVPVDIAIEFRNDVIQVTNNDRREHSLTFSLLDLQGRLVAHGKWSAVRPEQTIERNVTDLPIGPYVVVVTASQTTRSVLPIVVYR
jgi:hypothetical protein